MSKLVTFSPAIVEGFTNTVITMIPRTGRRACREGGDTLLEVAGLGSEHRAQRLDRRAVVLAGSDREHQLGDFERGGPASRHARCIFPGCVERASGLDHLIDQPVLQRLPGGERLAAEHHPAHDLGAEAAHQALRAGPARDHAERGLRHADPDMTFGDADIGGSSQFQAAAQRMAVDRGDDRHAQRRQPLEDAMPEAHPAMSELVGGHAGPGPDVASRREGLAVAGEDRDPHRRIGFETLACRRELRQHRYVEGVELLGTRHHDRRDGARDLDPDPGLRHGRPPQRGVAAWPSA